MTDDIIDQAIAESTAQVDVPQPIENSPNTPENVEPSQEEIAPEPKEPEDIPFPKKAVNAISRKDKKIYKLQGELAAERALLAKYQEQEVKAKQEPLVAEKFDNYGEFLKAETRRELEQEQAEKLKQQQAEQDQQFHQNWVKERAEYATGKIQEAVASIPDFETVIRDGYDIAMQYPPYLENAFLQLDNPQYAFYALGKEDALESLLEMHPAKAIMEIAKAEIRGEALAKQKPVTKAPAPLNGLKAAGGSSKSFSSFNEGTSWDTIKAWLK